MPLGRVYQAPAVPVPRNTPVYKPNGLKAVTNAELVVTGKAVRPPKAKSPSPVPSKNGGKAPARKSVTKKKVQVTSARSKKEEDEAPRTVINGDVSKTREPGNGSCSNGKEWSPSSRNSDSDNEENNTHIFQAPVPLISC